MRYRPVQLLMMNFRELAEGQKVMGVSLKQMVHLICSRRHKSVELSILEQGRNNTGSLAVLFSQLLYIFSFGFSVTLLPAPDQQDR